MSPHLVSWLFWICLILMLVVAIAALAAAAWRFFSLRSRGTNVIMRELPASGNHGWRHGTLRYGGETLEYFKLRSLMPWANLVLDRREVEILGTRNISESEAEFMPDEVKILTIAVGEHRGENHGEYLEEHETSGKILEGKRYEVGLEAHGEMALRAWVESAPDLRQQRVDYWALRDKLSREQALRDKGRGAY